MPWPEMLKSTPTAVSVTASEVPPELTNGSGTPVIGSVSVTTPMLISVWNVIHVVIPAATITP